MENFNYYNPTEIFFGKDAIQNLGENIAIYKNVLLCYGGGSIKKNGIYDAVIKILEEKNINVFELSGITPNPRASKVYEGIEICKDKGIDFILAVGGGSTIDCAKAIAVGAKTNRDFWQAFYVAKERADGGIPLASILTLAGTGSEMDAGSVITNEEEGLKYSYESVHMFPKFSILDPTYTYSLPQKQLVYGTVDILSHIFELYFSPPDETNLSDDLAEAVMKNVIKNLDIALKEPGNYIARSNLMWDSTVALQGILKLSKKQDWQTHEIEHAVSAFNDVAHGAGLAIIHPNYLAYVLEYAQQKLARYAVNVMNVNAAGKTEQQVAKEGVQKTKEYFKSIGAPVTLTEIGVKKEDLDGIADKVLLTGGGYKALSRDDIYNILVRAL